MTEPEKKLWYGFLRDLSQKSVSVDWTSLPLGWGGLRGSFRMRIYRQRPIDNFIVDFYISACKIVIEIDWDSHYEEGAEEYDAERSDILEGFWIRVVRYTNDEVMNNFESVCVDIWKKLKNTLKP